jgi:predicted nucleotide-binding protein
METRDEIATILKKLYVHLQLLGLHGYFKSDKFDLFCEENGLDKTKDKIVSALHQELGIPRPLKHSLSTSGKIVVDFSNFPEALVKPFLKDLLIEIYSSKALQFVEIVVSFLTYYSQYNRNLKTWKPTPIDDALIRTIALDLVNICDDDEDVRMFLKFAGYDSDAILSVLDPEPTEIQPMSGTESHRNIVKELSKKVFIIHGHDEKIKNEVEELLLSIRLEPIILHKQADLGKTIIEKVEHYVSQTSFAVAILTKDDFGISKATLDFDHFIIDSVEKYISKGLMREDDRNHIDDLIRSNNSSLAEILTELSREMLQHNKPRSRQNVIFELGITIGQFGRDRVRVLYEEGVELPTDIHGLVYIPLKSDWKNKLAQEIGAAGIKIDENFL